MQLYYIAFFVIFYIVAVVAENNTYQTKARILILSLLVLTWGAGTRGEWPDTINYISDFLNAPSLLNLTSSDGPQSYAEYGFWLIGVVVKTLGITNEMIYLTVVAGLSLFFLYKGLREYCAYPLIGLCTYLARFFMGRQLMQIRAGLAYAIIIFAVIYIYRKDWKRYFFWVFVAYLFHHSSLIAVPLYFICNWVKITKKWVVTFLVLAFLVAIYGQNFVHNFVEDNATDLEIMSYTEQGGEANYVESLGLKNPMIYYQTLLLLLYTFNEKRIATQDRYYYVIRTAYLYSTCTLLFFCTYKVLAGRTSTMFATFEFSIVPSLIYMFNKRNRTIAMVLIGMALTAILALYMRQGTAM